MEPTSYPMASKRERIFRMSGQHDIAGFNYMHNGSNGNGNSKHELNGRSKALRKGKGRAAMELEDSWKGNLRSKGITRPYCGRRGGRLWRPAECLRAYEVYD